MASGWCYFCQMWHSGGCCHPSRMQFEKYKMQFEKYKNQKDRLYNMLNEVVETFNEIRPDDPHFEKKYFDTIPLLLKAKALLNEIEDFDGGLNETSQ